MSSGGLSPSTSSSFRWANPAAMIPRSPCPSIRLKGASSAHRSTGRQPIVQGAVLLHDVAGDGHEPPGFADQPQVRLAVRALGDVDRLDLLDEAPGDRGR